MKIAELRPPLIEISINQPKVVTLSKDKKGNYEGSTVKIEMSGCRTLTVISD